MTARLFPNFPPLSDAPLVIRRPGEQGWIATLRPPHDSGQDEESQVICSTAQEGLDDPGRQSGYPSPSLLWRPGRQPVTV